MKKVAIVGSEEKYWTPEQRTKVVLKIKEIFETYGTLEGENYCEHEWSFEDVVLVSGGCPKGGVDIWAEIVADVLGIEKDIKYPEINRWEDQYVCVNNNKNIQTKLIGYKSRNIQIAEACDVLYCIDPKGRKRSGGRWTLTYAEKLGKETHLVLVE